MMGLKVYFFGYGGHSWQAEKFRELIEDELGMKLVTIHEHPNANVQWNLATIFEELKKADIIILPNSYKRQACKSNNKLTQAMALGKPVICDPMPSYIPIVKNLENAIITTEGAEAEYRTWLKFLRDNEKERIEMGKKALETAKKYTQEEMSVSWVNALSKLPKKYKNKEKDIDVIIPTKNNIEFLDECLKSFSNSTLNEEVYIIENGTGVEDLVKKYNIPYEIKEI